MHETKPVGLLVVYSERQGGVGNSMSKMLLQNHMQH